MACITEGAAGFPGFSARIPFENGTIAEVLNERGWNTYAIGKWHLTPADEVDLSSWKGRWPLGRGFERFYGFLGGETNQWYPDLVYDNHTDRAAGYARGGLPPLQGPGRQGDRVRPRRQGGRARQALVHVLLPGLRATRRTTCSRSGPTATRAASTRATRRSARRSSPNQKRLGLLPDDAELSPINPHGEPDATGPDGQPWPQLDFVRPWDSLTDDERRLFARMAEVYAGFVSYTDDQIGAPHRLPRGVRAARQHDRRGRLRQRRQRRGRPERLVQREQVLQRRARHDRGEPRAPRRARAARAPTTTTTPAGRGRSTPRSRTGSASPATRAASPTRAGLLAEGDRGARRGPRPVRPRGRRRARRSTSCSASSRPTSSKGYTQSPIEGESFARSFSDPAAPGRETQFYSMLGHARALPPGLARQHPAPADLRLGQLRPRRVGALPPRRGPLPDCATSPPSTPSGSRSSRGCGSTTRGSTRGCRSTTAPRSRSSQDAAPQPSAPRDRYVYYPGTAEVPESVAVNVRRRSYTIAARCDARDPGGRGRALRAGRRAGGHALYLKDGRLHYVYNWLGEREQTVSSDGEVPTGSHVLTRRVPEDRRRRQTMSATGTLTLYVDTEPSGAARS